MDISFKETISTGVVLPDDTEATLMIEHDDNVLTFYIDGQEVFGGDWFGNFGAMLARAVNLWGNIYTDNEWS